MSNPQKRNEDIKCNCRNSKCMKLYCECFAARLPCSTSCHCVDCHNTSLRDNNNQMSLAERRGPRDELIRTHRGCACRKSGCTKKYCECFQAGILCKDTCKCVDCQNNQSLTNKRVIMELRRNNSDISNSDNTHQLYPLYLSQNPDNLRSILTQSNPLNLDNEWLDNCARLLYESVKQGSATRVMQKLVQILKSLQEKVNQNVQQSEQLQIAQSLIKQQVRNQNNLSPQDSQNHRKFSTKIGNIIIPANSNVIKKQQQIQNQVHQKQEQEQEDSQMQEQPSQNEVK